MQEAEALQILQRMGGAPTPRNLQLIMNQAPNENAILGKSLGLQGGEGQGQDSIVGQLDKLDAATNPKAVAQSATVSDMPTEAIPVAVAPRRPVVATPTVPEGTGFVGPTSRGPAVVTGTTTGPPGTYYGSEGDLSGGLGGAPVPGVGNSDAQGPGLLTLLASILGVGAAAKGATGRTSAADNYLKSNPTMNTKNTQADPIDRGVAADKINEDRRPINTNVDERNAEVKNKPVNMNTRPAVPDDAIPTNLVETVAKNAKRLKGIR